MLVTVVRLMYEAVEWLWKWRNGVRCMRLIYENLSHSSVILRQTADNAVPYNELASVTGDGIHVVSAVRVLWTYRSRQLAVLPSQLKLSLTDGWTSYDDVSLSSVLCRHGDCEQTHDDVHVMFDMTSSAALSQLSPEHLSLKDFVKLVAWKPGQGQGHDGTVAALCRGKDFDSLLRFFVAGGTLRHDDQHVMSFTTVQFCADTSWSHGDTKVTPAVTLPDAAGLTTVTLSNAANLTTVMPSDAATAQRRACVRSKPPNIVIYCGKKDSSRLFAGVKSVISQCVNMDQYIIYHLKHEQVSSTPWQDNTALLVIASDKVYDGVDRQFLDYFLRGGTLISFGSAFDGLIVERRLRLPAVSGQLGLVSVYCEGYDHVSLISSKYCYTPDCRSVLSDVMLTCLVRDTLTDQPVVVEAAHQSSAGLAILSQAYLDKDPVELAISSEVFTTLKRSNAGRFAVLTGLLNRLGLNCDQPVAPPLTSVCLLATSEVKKSQFLELVNARLQDGSRLVGRDATLRFVGRGADTLLSAVNNNDTLTVLTDCVSADHSFNEAVYCHHLNTRLLGNVVLYADVTTTTMSLIDGLMLSCPRDVGLIAVARRQLAGRGRSGNSWLSLDGCAMFSVHVRVSTSSHLGQRVSFVQHLMSLAVVLAVRRKHNCHSVDVRIKWPNDIYFGRDVKLGGVIVKSSVMQDVIHVNIGCGVNVTNKDPTVCINDVLQQPSDLESRSQLELFTVEEVIARSVSVLEELIDRFETEDRQTVLDQYYQYWLHSDCVVRLVTEAGSQHTVDAKIVGLDEFGFLQVTLADGSLMSVQPDGNSFDMMRNLILPK